jgi:amino acid adenylation domain-containing protein
LQELGVGPGTLVGLMLERSADAVLAILAVLKAGGGYLPVDPDHPQERLRLILDDARVSLMVTRRPLLARLPFFGGAVVRLDADADAIACHSGKNLDVPLGAEDPAYVVYTSGSTGRPKGVVVPHASLRVYMESLRSALGIESDDVYLHTAPFAFSSAVRQTMLPLCHGATLVIADRDQRRDPVIMFELMKENGVTVWETGPSYWRDVVYALSSLTQEQRQRLMSRRLRMILVTGDALDWEIPRSWTRLLGNRARIFNMYSQTETTGTTTIYPLPELMDGKTGLVPLGWPVENTEIQVLDEKQQPVAPGEMGEIYVGGPRLAQGYLNRSDLTTQHFLPNPNQSKPGERIFKTGDLARSRPDGNLEFMGRADDQVKIRGYRVGLVEVEAAVASHPGVREVAVIPDVTAAGTRLVAYVALASAGDISHESLRSFIKTKLPEYMTPSQFVFVDALPRTASGKLNRRAMRKPSAAAGTSVANGAAPRPHLEEVLTAIWAEVLENRQVTPGDDFFALGGNSLQAIRVISRVNAAYQLNFTAMDLFEAPTVEALAVEVLRRLTDSVAEEQMEPAADGADAVADQA